MPPDHRRKFAEAHRTFIKRFAEPCAQRLAALLVDTSHWDENPFVLETERSDVLIASIERYWIDSGGIIEELQQLPAELSTGLRTLVQLTYFELVAERHTSAMIAGVCIPKASARNRFAGLARQGGVFSNVPQPWQARLRKTLCELGKDYSHKTQSAFARSAKRGLAHVEESDRAHREMTGIFAKMLQNPTVTIGIAPAFVLPDLITRLDIIVARMIDGST